ncbi:hypothetical protein M378DRAFT_15195 [Amanita muscaria Koide BX008]|uniref:Uncharacterized protein n=1 Tax=Amanita muscaria (strain Koide BX008) TaxID=946122 RepID=A0A0C2WCA7_AMAMK|nr:hypothetical protein M378DRAFT_15195 [Amanita muscaria Koide BX008]
MLTHSQSFFVEVFIQALLYGIYLATLIQCFRWLIFTDEGWKPREKINSVMTMATIFFFLTSTTNLATTLVYELDVKRGHLYVYENGTVMIQNISELLGIISIDCVLIYRCWIVYAKSLRAICVPVIFWLASVACMVLFAYYTGLYYKRQTLSPEIAQLSERALVGLYTCNIATTIYTTTAIIYRVLRTRKTSGGSPKRLNYVMRILADSGILYTSMITFALVGRLLASWHDPDWIEILIADISDVISFSTAGITFNLILIRVYHVRVESRDSLADSINVSGEKILSGMQFNNPQITASSEMSSFNARDEAIGEIQEHRRSSDGLHEN